MAKHGNKAPQPTIDPELKRQLDAAGDDSAVEAVFTLTTPVGEKYRSIDSTAKTVKKILDAAESDSNATTGHVKVFPNLQSFAVSAPASLVRCMLKQQEIASASANEQNEDLMIRPVSSKPPGSSSSGSEEKSMAPAKSKKEKPASSQRSRNRKKPD